MNPWEPFWRRYSGRLTLGRHWLTVGKDAFLFRLRRFNRYKITCYRHFEIIGMRNLAPY